MYLYMGDDVSMCLCLALFPGAEVITIVSCQMWVLAHELGSSVRTIHGPNHIVISPALWEHLLTRVVNKKTQSCILLTSGVLMLGN